MNSRRVIANLFVEPSALVRLSIPFFALVIAITGFEVVIYLELANAFAKAKAAGNTPAIAALEEVFKQVGVLGAVGLAVLAIVCFGYWIVYSHRIFGPVVPIRRHIQKLTAGDFTSRINLRPSDEFTNIAGDLNALADSLQKLKK